MGGGLCDRSAVINSSAVPQKFMSQSQIQMAGSDDIRLPVRPHGMTCALELQLNDLTPCLSCVGVSESTGQQTFSV